jgi:hypothetical protein
MNTDPRINTDGSITPGAPANARAALDDERGAVMVLGLFLALGVIAAMWCLIGIGDAIIARDITQEATDSAAFTNAVMHARGMNVITFINMVMLAFVEVYLLLSWLDLIVSSVWLLVGVNAGPNWCELRDVTDIFGFDVPWCTIAKGCRAASKSLLKADKKVFDLFEKIAPRMFQAQVWVAQIVPWLGTAVSADIGHEYDRLTLSGSLSLIPGGGAIHPLNKVGAIFFDRLSFLQHQSTRVDKTGQNRPMPDINWLQDRRIGLPLESEGAYQLCIRGARFPIEAAKDKIAAALHQDWVGKEPGGIISYAFSQGVGELNRLLFCNQKDEAIDLSMLSPRFFRDVTKPGPAGQAKRKEWLKKLIMGANNHGLRLLFKAGLWEFSSNHANDKFYLERHYVWRMNWPDPMKNMPDPDNWNRYDDGFVAGPKRVPAYAYNSNDWMQIWAVSLVDPPTNNTAAARIVSMPSGIFGKKPAVNPDPERTSAADPSLSWAVAPDPAAVDLGAQLIGKRAFVSQAEFYFDCGAVWISGECNKGAAATYQLRWRARLRRVHDIELIADYVEILMDNFLQGPVFVGIVKDWTEKVLHNPILREGIVKALRNYAIRFGSNIVDNVESDGSSRELLH